MKLEVVRVGLVDQDVIATEHSLDLKLADGSIVSLKTSKNAVPNYKKNGSTEFNLKYTLTAEQVDQIAQSNPLALRITAIPDVQLSGEVKSKKGKKISEEIKCLLK